MKQFSFSRVFFALAFCLSILPAKAQNLNPHNWMKFLDDSSLNYYQRIDSANLFFDQHDSLRQNNKYGYKDFIRWQYYWQNRLDANYKPTNIPLMLDSIATYGTGLNPNRNPNSTIASNTVAWRPLGPIRKAAGTPTGVTDGYGIGMLFCLEINPLNHNIVYGGGPDGGLWRTDNKGQSWGEIKLSNSTIDFGVIGVLSIHVNPNDTSEIYIATGNYKMEAGYSTAYSFGILKSTNSGSTWNQIYTLNTNTPELISDLAFDYNTSPKTIYAISRNYIYQTQNDFQNFSSFDTKHGRPENPNLNDIKISPYNHNIVAIAGSELWVTLDAGGTWTNYTPFMNKGYYDNIGIVLDSRMPNIIFSVTKSGYTFLREKVNISNPTASSSNAITLDGGLINLLMSPNDTNIIYFGGVKLRKSTNGGLIFGAYLLGLHDDVRNLRLLNLNGQDLLYVAHDGGFGISNPGVTSFKDYSYDLNIANFYNLASSEDNTTYLFGGTHDNGTVKLSKNSEIGWSHIHGGDGFGESFIIDPSESLLSNTIWFLNDTYSLSSRSIRADFTIGSLPSQPSLSSRFLKKSKTGNLFEVFNVSSNGKKISKTDDYCQTWEVDYNNLSEIITEVEISSSNSNIWYAGFWTGTENKLRKSTDKGLTFVDINNPVTGAGVSDIEILPNNPNIVWVCYGGYSNRKVFKSTDGGIAWNELGAPATVSTLGEFPVNCLAFDNVGDVLYAGTDRGVYYYDEQNSHWYEFNIGLPKCVINQLNINYASRKLSAATFGRGIWETDLPTCIKNTTVIEILENTTISSVQTFSSDIVIKPNATLTVIGTIKMIQNSKITINAGAKLVINGGIITSSDCGLMWDGIIVEGNKNLVQSATTHGKIEIYNEGTIQFAKLGVKCLEGGIINFNHANFINCRGGVSMEAYHSPISNGYESKNLSRIWNSNFTCNAPMRDPQYEDNGIREGSKWFVSLNNLKGVSIVNNVFASFVGTREDLRGNGISTYRTSAFISGNNFKNLTYGIEAGGYSSPLEILTIVDNNFENTMHGVTLTNVSFARIESNSFLIPTLVQKTNWVKSVWGVNARNCNPIDIIGNNFYKDLAFQQAFSYGIIIKNSDKIISKVSNNTFSKIQTGTQCENDNSELLISCNNYDQYVRQAWSIDPIVDNISSEFKSPQGSPDPLLKQAGNLFYNQTEIDPYKHIRSGIGFVYNAAETPSEAIPIFVTNNITVQPVTGKSNDLSCISDIIPCLPPCTDIQDLITLAEEGDFKNLLYNELIRAYADSGLIAQTIALIESSDLVNKNYLLLPAYIQTGDFTNANLMLDSLATDTQSVAYKSFYETLLSLSGNDTEFEAISNSQVAELHDIANSNLIISDAALYFLKWIKNENYLIEPEEWEENGSRPITQNPNTDTVANKKSLTENISFSINPNPLTGNGKIIYNSNSTFNKIQMVDLFGRVLFDHELQNKSGEVEFNASSYNNGIYFMRFISNKKLIQIKKVIILNK